jgi:thiamine biosynthesis lipoprotein ApbE
MKTTEKNHQQTQKLVKKLTMENSRLLQENKSLTDKIEHYFDELQKQKIYYENKIKVMRINIKEYSQLTGSL